jgi:serine/threonine-protein kinase HipA
MIRVWTDAAEAGFLDRYNTRGSTFVYEPGVAAVRAVSVTMPVRLPSWDVQFGLLPIFEMNLPEGALRERLRLAFAKATGKFDDFDLLGIIGRSQIGRIRYTHPDDRLHEEVPFQSIDEILEGGRGGDLLRYLIDKFASFSGISGVQPKILVRDENSFAAFSGAHDRGSHSFRGATHIVKFWERNEYPQLAANEFFCLKVAEKCGLEVPSHRLTEDALALVIDRFDLRPDGTYRGFEDFCVLNARRTDEKYRGSYESSIMKRFTEFANSTHVAEDLERLFTLIAVNCALRNGDAHLKNFGIVYDDVQGEARLAPVYDLITTSVYLPRDAMALTLNGTTNWADAKRLRHLGEARMGATPARVRAILDRIDDALTSAAADVRAYIAEHPEFNDIGSRMLQEWERGAAHSIRLPQMSSRGSVASSGSR